MTNRDVLDGLSNRTLARVLVRFGIECRHCPARDACAGKWEPCEKQLERWLEREYTKEEKTNVNSSKSQEAQSPQPAGALRTGEDPAAAECGAVL